ncbi:hypothetical protein [uncultured Nostoc sp.]|uniref:hypothetical protein n=1 Tax=uncultured Nostoc sp. TaxID=340711 RepID=UPI0026166B0D|nr:hypothetical protein [uncultured Nostoc sp.]
MGHNFETPGAATAIHPTAYSFARSSLCFRQRVRLVIGWSLRGALALTTPNPDFSQRFKRLAQNVYTT